jgi:ubiquinone/menaquinone biosynthesis C-methylase UbiE
MKPAQHTMAKPSYYNTRAHIYDELKENHAKIVLDMTCGTGPQVFRLKERGFDIMGSDISRHMLQIAKQKAKNKI